VCFESDNVGEEVMFRQGEVLDDEIKCVVGIFDTVDVVDLVRQGR